MLFEIQAVELEIKKSEGSKLFQLFTSLRRLALTAIQNEREHALPEAVFIFGII